MRWARWLANRVLAVAVAAATVGCAAAAPSPSADGCPTNGPDLIWTTYVPRNEAGFTVAFPGETYPSRNVHQPLIDDRVVTLNTASVRFESCSFVVGWAYFPTSQQAGLGHREAGWLAEGLGGKVESEGEALVGGLPGYEFTVSGRGSVSGTDGRIRVREQYLVIDRHLYLLQALSDDPPGANPLADEFFASFTVEP